MEVEIFPFVNNLRLFKEQTTFLCIQTLFNKNNKTTIFSSYFLGFCYSKLDTHLSLYSSCGDMKAYRHIFP